MADFVRHLQDIAAVREIRGVRVPQRIFRKRDNPFDAHNDCEFRKRYRLTKEAVKFVLSHVGEEIKSSSSRETDITPLMQVLITLRFFAKGCYQLELGDLHGVSQTAVSAIVAKVSRAIAAKLPGFIKWPTNAQASKEAFFNLAGFPGVVGCLDCTHVRVRNPHGTQPLLYCNRKGFYSLNVQIVCDASTRIVDIVARWRGSVHDSRIWSNCTLKEKFDNNDVKGILLGDSGYPCSRYLLTPLLSPHGRAELAYNKSHKSTRVTVECCFGRWKGMFRALQNGMLLDLETSKASIVAMAILYNIKLDFDPDWNYEDEEVVDSPTDEDDPVPSARDNVHGNLFRRRFINEHFA